MATGALAMALTDLPTSWLGMSDPASRPTKDWASDAVPHLVHGLVTYGIVTSDLTAF